MNIIYICLCYVVLRNTLCLQQGTTLKYTHIYTRLRTTTILKANFLICAAKHTQTQIHFIPSRLRNIYFHAHTIRRRFFSSPSRVIVLRLGRSRACVCVTHVIVWVTRILTRVCDACVVCLRCTSPQGATA